MLTLDDYLLPCGGGGGSGGGKVGGNSDGGNNGDGGGGGGGGGNGSGGSCKWLWLLFIVVNILFYCDIYIILLC